MTILYKRLVLQSNNLGRLHDIIIIIKMASGNYYYRVALWLTVFGALEYKLINLKRV